MYEEIKLKAPSHRIDNLLAQLSGIIPTQNPKITLLDFLYKEIDNEINEGEREEIIRLFSIANDRKNMVYSMALWSRERNYQHKEEFLNDIELYLRMLLAKYGHYSIKKENVDYQLGEE